VATAPDTTLNGQIGRNVERSLKTKKYIFWSFDPEALGVATAPDTTQNCGKVPKNKNTKFWSFDPEGPGAAAATGHNPKVPDTEKKQHLATENGILF
jgi:hypothetical protein